MKTILFLLMISILVTNLYSQYIPSDERGESIYRRESNLDAGNVLVTLHNNLISGADQGGPTEYRFAWPNNRRYQYIYFIQQWIGAEVIDENGDTLNIVSVPSFRTSPVNPEISWTFQPVPGYSNPDFAGIASSDNPESWPTEAQGGWLDKQNDSEDPGWIGSWNSMWGKNNFLAKQEFFYHSSDDQYHYPDLYTPDSTDPGRGGLGLIVSQRVFVLDFLPDEVFFVADIYNSGTKDIEKVASSLWIADLIGGNSQDDLVLLDTTRQIIYFSDADRREVDWGDEFTGFPGLFFLETPLHHILDNPVETRLSGAVRWPAGSIGDWNNDRLLFNRYMTPGVFDLPSEAGDFDIWITNGYFNLPAGESQRLAYVVTFGQEIEVIEAKYQMIHTVYDAISSGTQTMSVTLNNPGIEEEISGNYEIIWNAMDNDPGVQISILYSEDNGTSWQLIADKIENNGGYTWNTNDVPDGILNRIKILAWDDSQFNIVDSKSVFTINNPVEASPQIRIVSPGSEQALSGIDTLRWISGDADGDGYYVILSYKNIETGSSGTISDSVVNSRSFTWDTKLVANSSNYTIYAAIYDGENLAIDSVENITVYNERDSLSESYHIQRNTIGTGKIEVNVFDESALQNRNYRLRFRQLNDQLVYDVIDTGTKDSLVTAASEIYGTEGPAFDGLRLFVESDPTKLIPELSGWNTPDVYSYNFDIVRFLNFEGTLDAADYQVIFDNTHIDTSAEYVVKGGGISIPFNSVPVNVKVNNLTSSDYTDFAFYELHGTDGLYSVDPNNNDFSDILYFLKTENDSLIPTWSVLLNNSQGSRNPQAGDTLTLITSKAFQPGDTYYFGIDPTAIKNPHPAPKTFKLSQSYPNPFNANTRFRFYTPKNTIVKADVYDILGRKIKSLLNGKFQAGNHILNWDGKTNGASDVASGIYFLHVKAGSFLAVRKMLLIK